VQIIGVNARDLPVCLDACPLWAPLYLLSKSLLRISTINFTNGTKGRFGGHLSYEITKRVLMCLEIIRPETLSSLFLSLPRQLLKAKLTPVCYFQPSSWSMPAWWVRQQPLFLAVRALRGCL